MVVIKRRLEVFKQTGILPPASSSFSSSVRVPPPPPEPLLPPVAEQDQDEEEFEPNWDPDAEASLVYSENDNDYLSIDDGLSTAPSKSVAVAQAVGRFYGNVLFLPNSNPDRNRFVGTAQHTSSRQLHETAFR